MRITDAQGLRALVAGRAKVQADAEAVVAPILDAVQDRGDAALFEYAKKFDGFEGDSFLLSKSDFESARDGLEPDLLAALEVAAANIREFAQLQLPREFVEEVSPGRRLGQVVRPLDRIAAYVPGGRYPLPSTVLMTCCTAEVAGVKDIWMTSPKLNPVVLGAAGVAGASSGCVLGGAQAIAAFAFGTESVPKADRIVGPGNAYVTAAKKLLAGEVGIDFLAGPTEILIICEDGDPAWLAADLLSQAEHDADASSLLLTTSQSLAEAVSVEVERQLTILSTGETARVAIERNSAIAICESVAECVELSNEIAPEHLCIYDPAMLSEIRSAGSVFVGPFSTEAAGDYVTGPNHVLPTGGAARLSGGLSVLNFVKVISVQELSDAAIRSVGPAGVLLARAEGLEGHARSIEARLGEMK
jgi:histidinol dehydrogenase